MHSKLLSKLSKLHPLYSASSPSPLSQAVKVAEPSFDARIIASRSPSEQLKNVTCVATCRAVASVTGKIGSHPRHRPPRPPTAHFSAQTHVHGNNRRKVKVKWKVCLTWSRVHSFPPQMETLITPTPPPPTPTPPPPCCHIHTHHIRMTEIYSYFPTNVTGVCCLLLPDCLLCSCSMSCI